MIRDSPPPPPPPMIGAIVNFIAYYVIGLPVGAVIGFKTDLGVLGIWLGMLAGNVVQVLYTYTIMICFFLGDSLISFVNISILDAIRG